MWLFSNCLRDQKTYTLSRDFVYTGGVGQQHRYFGYLYTQIGKSFIGMKKDEQARCFTSLQRNMRRASDLARPCDNIGKTGSSFSGSISDKSPSAHTTTMLHDSMVKGCDIMARCQSMIEAYSEDKIFCTLVELMMCHGLRVSEVIGIKPSDISPRGVIRVRAKKNSLDKLVESKNYRHVILHIRNKGFIIDRHYNRHLFYRRFRKYGVYGVYGSNTKRSVTHSMRHEVALDLMQISGDIENVQLGLGHKNRDNSYIYVRDQKK